MVVELSQARIADLYIYLALFMVISELRVLGLRSSSVFSIIFIRVRFVSDYRNKIKKQLTMKELNILSYTFYAQQVEPNIRELAHDYQNIPGLSALTSEQRERLDYGTRR